MFFDNEEKEVHEEVGSIAKEVEDIFTEVDNILFVFFSGKCLVIMMKQPLYLISTSFDFSLSFKLVYISDHICSKPWGSKLGLRGGHIQTQTHLTKSKPRSQRYKREEPKVVN